MKFEEIIDRLRRGLNESPTLDAGNKRRANAYLDKLVKEHKRGAW